MDDWSFIFGWAAYNGISFCRRTSWISHDARAAAHHDQHRGCGPAAAVIRWVYAISFVPWVLSIWLFARTYSAVDSVNYWLALSFLAAGILAEKLWLLMHWEHHNKVGAALSALSATVCYVTAAVFIGICANGSGWEWIPALVMTICAALWLAWLGCA